MESKAGGPEIRSDLEMTVLGVVWKRQPCTRYAVTREFADSPSSHWRGGEGSIYPLMRRLEAAGLLESKPVKTGRRRSRLYSITSIGQRTLRDWLRPPMAEENAAITFDPIRTRMFFLGVLPEAERCAFLADAEEKLRHQVRVVQAEIDHYQAVGDKFSAFAFAGARKVVLARMKWVREIRQTIEMR